MSGGNRSVLLIGDALGDGLGATLSLADGQQLSVEQRQDLATGLVRLNETAFGVIVLAAGAGLESNSAALADLLAAQPGVAVIVAAADSDEAAVTRLLREGAKEVLSDAQISSPELVSRIQRAMARSDAAWSLLSGMVKESETRYRALFNQATDTILLLQPAGKGVAQIIDANDTACDMHGYSYDELAGGPVSRLVAESSRGAFADLIERALAGETEAEEFEHVRQDGATFPVEVSMRAVEHGGRVGVQAICKDITLRRRAETDRSRFEDQLRQSQKMEAVGTLAGGLAHDMNNVLGAIMAVASVVRAEGAGADGVARDIEEILSACQRGRELTKNLLSFARKEPPQMRRFAINDVVREVESLLKHTFPKQVEVVLDVEKKLPLIQGDPGQINHALINICINGAHAMKGVGRLKIKTAMGSMESGHRLSLLGLKPGPYVVLRISDTGSGMDEHTLEHAFEPFFTTKPPGEGTGLGLAMVYSTIKTHRGLVTLESEEGRGTVVTMHIPAEEGEEGRRVLDSDAPFPVAMKAGKVLLIDDERMVRSAGERVLKSLGYDVLTAANGELGVQLYREHGPELELVILDLLMPVKNGEETFREILRIDPEARILITSGYAHALEVNKLLKAGALGFLEKPFDRRALNSAIIRVMQKPR